MSKISTSEVEKVSRLARVEIEPNKLAELAVDTTAILDFAEAIQEVETKDVMPTSQVTGLTDVWREDVVVKSDVSNEKLIAGAPQKLEGYVKVKKVL